MRYAVTGSTGLIGSALVRSLRRDGHEVLRLVRRPPGRPDEAAWDPYAGTVDTARLDGVEAVVHLAGAGVGDHRWTGEYKQQIHDSRVLGTRAIAQAVTRLDPLPAILISASAIGYYGPSDGRALDEDSAAGTGFLAETVVAWEAAADAARAAGVRVAHPRSGLVVATHGGAWARLFPLFRLGVGGRLGSGQQYWSFISLRDEVRALRFLLDTPDSAGAFNLTAPSPATNNEVTRAMAQVLRRPAILPVPAAALKLALGEFSHEVLGSQRVLPRRLTEAGFSFLDPTIHEAIRAALDPSSAT
ncbi:MAG: TIGR01777 family oxidoreductase [Actinomycetes bacterium]